METNKNDEHTGNRQQIGHTQIRNSETDIVAGANETDQLERLKENARREKTTDNASAYRKLVGMLFISLLIMYAVMFLNVDESDHIYLSLTRFYMALLMVTPMAALMILMMPMMYPIKKWNVIVVFSGAILFGLSLYCLRMQVAVGDSQYMKAMIPHHSSAIMTSRHANIKDPRVRALADSIINSQRREITEMKDLLKSVH